MPFIYILSDLTSFFPKYKVGHHDGNLNKLISRYVTYIPCLKVHTLFYIEDFICSSNVESNFKEKHYDNRIVNINGKRSEWFTMDLDEIMSSLNSIIHDHIKIKYTMTMYNEINLKFPDGNTNYMEHLISERKVKTARQEPVQVSVHEADREYAINNFCELIGIRNLHTNRPILQDIKIAFSQDEIDQKSDSHILIYFDTRSLIRRPDELDKPGYKISDKCENVAKLCAKAFGIFNTSIKSVQGAMSVIARSLQLWSEAQVINGQQVNKQINNIRVRYTPYLIVIKKTDVHIAYQLKSYKELEADKNIYDNPIIREIAEWMAKVLNVSDTSKVDEIYSKIIETGYKDALKFL